MNEIIKIKKAFMIEGKKYCLKQYDTHSVVKKILPKFYFEKIKNLTYEHVCAITTMYNLGFEMIPGFYGQRLGSGTNLIAMYNWFTMTGFDKSGKHHHIVIYLNYSGIESGIKLYMDYRLVGTFTTINDLIEYTSIGSIIPTKFDTTWITPEVENNLTCFDYNGMVLGENFDKNELIFGSTLPSIMYTIDYDKLVEINKDDYIGAEVIEIQKTSTSTARSLRSKE